MLDVQNMQVKQTDVKGVAPLGWRAVGFVFSLSCVNLVLSSSWYTGSL
jgi:hypothetical protein